MYNNVIRVVSPAGLSRIELSGQVTTDTLAQKIFENTKIARDNMRLSFDNKNWFSLPPNTLLSSIPQFLEEGVKITVQPINDVPTATSQVSASNLSSQPQY